MDQVGLFFKCQSCSDYVLTYNIQCPSGHQVCHSCFENLSNCATCQQQVAPSTRIPNMIHVSSGLDPIWGVSETFDLLLPSLLRLAPALHPCNEDEVLFSGKRPDNLNLNGADSLADQLLVASNNEVEETLSRLMLMASMSPDPTGAGIASGKANMIPLEMSAATQSLMSDRNLCSGQDMAPMDEGSIINDNITSTSSSPTTPPSPKPSSTSDLAVLLPPPGLLGPSSGRANSTTTSSLT